MSSTRSSMVINGGRQVVLASIPAANEGFTSGGDLIIRSSDGVEFNVHSVLLSLASSQLSKKINENNRAQAIQFSETAEVLRLVLRFIYPMPSPAISSLELLYMAMRVAEKYQLTSMKDRLREQLSLANSPVSAYSSPLKALCVATLQGFTPEAELAAKFASKKFDFATVDGLRRLINAEPVTSALVKLVGIPAVKTRVLAEVLFRFECAPMHINSLSTESLICAPCRKPYQNCSRQGAPEWQLRWARWIFDQTKDSPISTWGDFFNHSRLSMALYQPQLSATFYAYSYHEVSVTCKCISLLLSAPSPFQEWATGVYECLREELQFIVGLEAQMDQATW